MYNKNVNLNSDICWNNAKDLKNSEIGEYVLYNNLSAEDKEPYGSMPQITYTDVNLRGRPGYGVSDGYLIDVYSMLRNNPDSLTKDRCHIQLSGRSFVANPKLTGAKGDINKELDVLSGSDSRTAPFMVTKSNAVDTMQQEIKCNKSLMEENTSHLYPLLDCVKDIQDPNNIIPNWTRGGEDTRSYENKVKYNKCSDYYKM